MLVVRVCLIAMASRATSAVVASASSGAPSIASGDIAATHPKCEGRFTLGCLKLELARLISRHGSTNASYQPLPGLYIRHNGANSTADTCQDPDAAVTRALTTYLEAISIHVSLNESSLLPQVKTFGEDMLTGRSRRVAMYSAGTMAAVAFAMLAAMSGKALMASMLALMLSAMGALRGGGGGGGKTSHYEIITKPAALTAPAAHFYDHDPLVHSSGASSYAAGPSTYSAYSYGRMNDAERHHVDYRESEEIHAAPYRTVGQKKDTPS